MSFKKYRQASGYSEGSVKVQDSHVNQLMAWCANHHIDPAQLTYDEVLGFIAHERGRGIKSQSLERSLNSIRIYFDYLVDTGSVMDNVIRRVRIRQAGRRVLPQILTADQLGKLYQKFAGLPAWNYHTERDRLVHQRDVVVLGLMVYQGLTSGQVVKVERGHLYPEKGKIYIPSGRNHNARTLELQAVQVLPLNTYLEKTRPQLVKKQAEEDTVKRLFPVSKPSEMVGRIIRQLQRIDPEVESSRQIRASVIMGWLKTYNIRQVQYMAGHKSIRSTESYRLQDLTDLTRQLELFHPLR